ncbi:MAG: hypothetical protein KJ604_19990, partial [Gammaproteobacteria bacterium]|nr:hypothetical protein [Gammaproteobacteria bacterium]
DAVQKDIDKSRSGTKKESALQKKKDKLLETPSPFMTDEGKALKEQLYRAYLEDVVEGAEGVTASDEANRIAARAKLAGSKDAELEAYETLKKLTQDEAERQGVDPDEVESVSLSAASLLSQTPGHYTLEDRVNLEARDLMRRRGEVDRAEKKTETKPQQAAVILERENVVEAPGEPPAEADFILRPPIPDEEEAAIKAMKGKEGKVQPKDMGGKDSTNPVPATIYDGIFAVHKRAGKKGSVVTHIKTGLSIGGIYDNADAAKGVVYNLLKTDINWNFTEQPLFTKAEQDKAGDIIRRFGFGNAKESGVPENTIFFFGRGSETRPDYEDAYNILRNIAKEDADFKRDPVMTVTAAGDGWMTLEWRKDAPKKGGKRFYRIKVPVFETERDVLPQPGQAVRISEHWFDTALSPTEARRKFSKTDIPGELAPLEGVGRLEVLRFADTSLYDLYGAIRTRKQETSPHAYEDPELEARDLKNQGVERPSISKRLADFGERVWNRMSREYEHLGRGGEFSRLRFDLTRLQKQFTVSGSKAVERMDKTLSDLSRDDYDLFRRKVILDDLMYEVDEGRLTDDRRINGFGPEDVRREAARINEKVGKNKAVHEAIQKRNQAWNKIKADYIKAMEDIGFNVRDRFNNPAYFRHQVLEYINAKGLYGTGKKLKTPTGRGFLKKREGGNYDMNSDYLQSEYEVMSQMIYDIEVARTIKSVDDNYNIQEQLKARARSQNTENVMNIFRERAKDVEPTKADLEEAGPKGDVTEIIARKMYRMALNKKQAMGFKRLQDALARWEDERSPVPSDGRFDGLFEDLAVAREEAEAANADAAEMGMPAGVATVDVSDENQPLLFPYLAWLMKERRDTDAGRAAALIFKGMSEKRQFTKKELTKLGQYKTWQDLVPEGYVVWQPREGNMFYYAYSVPEIVAAQLGEGGMEKIGLTPDQIRKVMAVGGRRREFVVKEEVAATLDAMTKERPDSPAYRASRFVQRIWKQWILLGPRRLFKYNVRNLSGDGDALVVGNPSAFKWVPQASRELFAAMVRNAPLKGNMLDWFERGGTGATLQVQELGEVNDLEPFRRLQRKMYGNRMRNLPVRLAKQYWRAARISTDLRESILRYAAYLDYLEQMKANGGRPKNFGASIREEVMALDDIKDRAWKLSNDLLGAYDEVSVTGQGLREHLIPFWSWNEVNMRRYKRLVQNAIQDERSMQLLGRGLAGGLAIKAPMVALKVGKFAVMATALWSVMAAWNHLMYPDEEDELPEDVRGRPHIIYGRDKDGSVRYFSRLGAVADALEWFGADIAPQYVADFLNGRRTVKEIAIEMAKGAPNKLVQGITPIGPKGLLEVITRRQLFPDFTRPRLIRDRGLYVAELIGAGPEYMALRRKITGGPPGKPYGESVWDTFGYKIDPLQVAYWDIRGEQRRWETKQGKASEGFWLSPRGSALYNLRLAARYKDSVSQEKYAKEYIALQGTLRGMRQSFERMAPLAGMSKEDQKAFIASLDSEQLRQLGKAERFYNTVLLGEGGRGAEKIIHNFASALAPGLDTTEIRLEVARQRGRAMGLRRVNRTAEADEAERTARELVNSVGGEKAFNRMIHDEWLDRRNKQATAGERPR